MTYYRKGLRGNVWHIVTYEPYMTFMALCGVNLIKVGDARYGGRDGSARLIEPEPLEQPLGPVCRGCLYALDKKKGMDDAATLDAALAAIDGAQA